ncbi:TetR/AcrR family transcriptional regulator [Pseudofrankia inefficax]|uniref:Regulatory protein TetR n=1 Tax=Pseudofrankia inefficax (strain DSM 45817 / CECT 9037 / DDB 130130 / EuI1c) TaxID=298654 RepID=E3JBS1_PSEI1|nr:TetR/AcrR family transcriptional regulator [Pseudofrankia inefficax]ADP81091.1 regulatory protein TetR [Pseudofrankia inefficax]
MGHSRQVKDDNHRRVVTIAAARFREAGLDGPGVAELMQEAGLTHGGFYRHFASRDDLVAEAVEHLRAQFELGLDAVAERGVARLVADYLTERHRDAPATGCAVAALGGDIARSTDRARSAYTEQVRSYVTLLTTPLDADSDPAAARRRAQATLSALVGAMLLARAVNDDELSRELLNSVKDQLLGPSPS